MDSLQQIVMTELKASIKSDMVLAERLLIIDIEDDLSNRQRLMDISRDFIDSLSTSSSRLRGPLFPEKIRVIDSGNML